MKLFFAQQEAIETAFWLNEVTDKSNPGQRILNLFRNIKLNETDCYQNTRITSDLIFKGKANCIAFLNFVYEVLFRSDR